MIKYGFNLSPDSSQSKRKNIYDNEGNFNTNLTFNDIKEYF